MCSCMQTFGTDAVASTLEVVASKAQALSDGSRYLPVQNTATRHGSCCLYSLQASVEAMQQRKQSLKLN